MIINIVFLLLMPVCILGHLCLINPAQRGEMDISQPGSKTCFRHGAPCGGQDAGPGPYEIWYSGQQTLIRWLQNFNHYQVGYPGYMDVAIAPVNSTDWQLLAFVADKYVFAQYHQQNYSSFVIAPDKPCEHCVVRARYASHKSGEETFYQCADVTIKSSTESSRDDTEPDPNLLQYPEYMSTFKKVQTLTQMPKLFQTSGLSLRGFAYSPFDHDILYIVNVTFDGKITPFGKFNFGLDFNINSKERLRRKLSERDRKSAKYANAPENMMFLMDSVCTVNSRNNLVVVYHEGGSMDSPAASVVEFDSVQGKIAQKSVITGLANNSMSAIMSSSDGTYYTFSIESAGTKGYYFVVGQLFATNLTTGQFAYRQLIKSEPEPLYVNFQWAELDEDHNRIFVLMGNENEPIRLLARLYTFYLKKKTVTNVELQVEMSSFMNIHYYKKTGKLYAVTPGNFYMHYHPYWAIAEVDPASGKVKLDYFRIILGSFQGYYGGSIFSGLDQTTGILYHVFRMIDTDTDMIGAIDLENKNITYSPATNLRFVHNLSLTKN